jgi:hypothetical protein
MFPELLPKPKLCRDGAAEIRQVAPRSTSFDICAELLTLGARCERWAAYTERGGIGRSGWSLRQ